MISAYFWKFQGKRISFFLVELVSLLLMLFPLYASSGLYKPYNLSM